MNVCYVGFARAFMTLRECWLPDRSQEISEQAVADLNVCLEQLVERCKMIETKIEASTAQSYQIVARAKTESVRDKARSMMQIRSCLIDRRQYRAEYDRAQRSVAMLRRQISTILNSHLDTAIINAMKQYSAAAGRLGLPDKTSEVQRLTEELSDCMDQTNGLQDALGEVTDTFNFASRAGHNQEEDDEALQAELNALFDQPDDQDDQENEHAATAASGNGLRQRLLPPQVSFEEDHLTRTLYC